MSENNENQVNHYLTFKLGEETFASDVSYILKILEIQKITEVPKAPHFMKGVINMRGNVLPVIDARLKFGLTASPYTDKTCILVLSIEIEKETVEVGAIVDVVMDVIEYQKENIKPSPGLGSKYKSDFIEGIIKLNENFIMVLNMNAVFSTDEIIEIKEKTDSSEEHPKKTGNKIKNQSIGG